MASQFASASTVSEPERELTVTQELVGGATADIAVTAMSIALDTTSHAAGCAMSAAGAASSEVLTAGTEVIGYVIVGILSGV